MITQSELYKKWIETEVKTKGLVSIFYDTDIIKYDESCYKELNEMNAACADPTKYEDLKNI